MHTVNRNLLEDNFASEIIMAHILDLFINSDVVSDSFVCLC